MLWSWEDDRIPHELRSHIIQHIFDMHVYEWAYQNSVETKEEYCSSRCQVLQLSNTGEHSDLSLESHCWGKTKELLIKEGLASGQRTCAAAHSWGLQ